MTDQPTAHAVARPLEEPPGSGRWRVGLVVAGGVAVVAIGLVGPRPAPAPESVARPVATMPRAAPPTRGEAGGSAPDIARRSAVLRVEVAQAGPLVVVDGLVRPGSGPLVVSLVAGTTVLESAVVTPSAGRLSVVLRPRVPRGGLFGTVVVRPVRAAMTAAAVERTMVLEQTTAFRRSVDPVTGRTRLVGPRP